MDVDNLLDSCWCVLEWTWIKEFSRVYKVRKLKGDWSKRLCQPIIDQAKEEVEEMNDFTYYNFINIFKMDQTINS